MLKSKKTLAIIISCIGMLFVFGIYYWYMSTLYVKTDDARVSGSIVNISCKVPGKIKEVLVQEGDLVKIGQVLAVLDSSDLQEQVAQAQAGVWEEQAKMQELQNGARPQEIALAQTSLQIAQTNLQESVREYQRNLALYQQGAISEQNLDKIKTAYQVAKNQVQAAEEQLKLVQAGSREENIKAEQAKIQKAQALLAWNKKNLQQTFIVSPVQGIVALKQTNPGEVVAAGQKIVSVVNINDLWLNARIEETKIGKLHVGQSVQFTLDAYQGINFKGHISEIGAATSSVFALFSPENASGNFTKVTQRIPIKISLPKQEKYIFRPGMSAYVTVKVK